MRPGDHQTGSSAAAGKPEKVAELARQDEDTDGSRPAGQVRESEPDVPTDRDDTADQPGRGRRRQRPGRRLAGRAKAARAWAGRIWASWPRPAWLTATTGLARRVAGRVISALGSHPGTASAGFARLTVLPAILVLAWLLPGLPLLLAGSFLPVPMVLIAAPLAVVLVVVALRRVPASWPRALPGVRRERARDMWYGLAGTIVVAVGFTVWQLLFSSESLIVLRDSGALLQSGYWLAQHGALPIPQSLSAFGGASPGLTFSSTGFFASGGSVVPGSTAGLPMLLAGGFWVHGAPAATALGPVLGGMAVLAFGGLAGRLAGPRWAAAAALVLAVTLPEQYTSRAALGETALQVLLFGGLCLVIDAVMVHRSERAAAALAAAAGRPGRPRGLGNWFTPWRAMIALGGLCLGMTAVVQVGGLLDVVPAIAFTGILIAGRRAVGLAFSIGLVIGAGYGVAAGYLLARPFMASLRPAPAVIGLIAVWLAAFTLAAVELLRYPRARRWLRTIFARRPLRWLPEAAAIIAVLAVVALALRPYLQTVRGPATGGAAGYIAALQHAGQLRLDPGRTYAEDTLYWVIWYVGLPAILLGTFGLALLVRRCVRALITWRDPAGAARIWALPLAIISAGSAAVLWDPAITPDQPSASRRLVPLVLPGLIVCAMWAASWLVGWARVRGAGAVATSLVAACCVAAVLVPTAVTTFGLGLTHSGKGGGLRAFATGLALKRTGQGEISAVSRLCASIPPGSSVVVLDRRVAREFLQVIRGMCGVPAASMAGQPVAAVAAVVAGIGRAGRRPVLLAARPGQLTGFGGSPSEVLNLQTTQQPQTLTQPPTTRSPASYVIWQAVPASSSIGT